MHLPDHAWNLEAMDLRCLPQSLVRLLDACNGAEADMSMVAATAALDPGLTMLLFDAALATPAGDARKFVNLAEVLGRLGQPGLRATAVYAAAGHLDLADGSGADSGFDMQLFWR